MTTQPTPADARTDFDRAAELIERAAAANSLTAEIARLTRALRQAQDERDAAREDAERLEKFAHRHLRNCATGWSDDCTCGLSQTLAAHAQATAEAVRK